MSRPAPVEQRRLPGADVEPDELRAAALRRRRIAAARVRRRRLMLGDLAVAVTVAVLAVILAPGLAIVALGAVFVLGAYGAWLAGARLRAWRARRQTAVGGRGEGGPRSRAEREQSL
jgi:hypothetical protein